MAMLINGMWKTIPKCISDSPYGGWLTRRLTENGDYITIVKARNVRFHCVNMMQNLISFCKQPVGKLAVVSAKSLGHPYCGICARVAQLSTGACPDCE